MLRGVWKALICLSIHATYCVMIAGARLHGKQKCGLRYVKTAIFALFELSFHSCNVLRDCHRAEGRPQGKQKMKAWVRKND